MTKPSTRTSGRKRSPRQTQTSASSPGASPSSAAGSSTEADAIFARVSAEFLELKGVTGGTGFGKSQGLRVRGKIFAMAARGRLVVKLPRPEAQALAATDGAAYFDPGHGRLMREWVTLPAARAIEWPTLMRQALAYVGG